MLRDRNPRALAIRDHLLPLIRANGTLVQVGNASMKVLAWKMLPWGFSLRTPFSPFPAGRAPRTQQEAVLKQQAGEQMGYGLDIGYEGKKVFNLEWDDTRHVVVTFKRGGWEEEALHLT